VEAALNSLMNECKVSYNEAGVSFELTCEDRSRTCSMHLEVQASSPSLVP